MSDTPTDDTTARESVRRDLDTTLFVEAGAGSGKSTALVSRIVELVATGATDIAHVAAITFTEAAAAELRDRVREALERTAAGNIDALLDPDYADRPDDERQERAERCRAAIADVDAAAISTLHSFAQRILRDHPLEGDLPPGISVLDQLQSAVEFQDRWDDFLDVLYGDDAHQDLIVRALAVGIDTTHLRAIAAAFNDNWDLVEDADLPQRHLTGVDPAPVLDAVRHARSAMGHCIEPDQLFEHLEGLEGFETRLARTVNDLETLELLRDSSKLSIGRGAQKNWDDIEPAEIRHRLETAEEAKSAILERAAAEALAQLLVVLRTLTLEAVEDRRSEGRLEFHDLLVFARDLLRKDPGVADELGRRYTHLLIDEFQDTDPIQAELAVRIATPAAAPDTPWRDLRPEAGRLCFVGDPKQSIYRFRRADIELFTDVRDRVVGDELQLNRNFRSVPGIIDWVNAVFTELFEPELEPAQPRYIPLTSTRAPVDHRPPVVLLGGPHDEKIAEVRAAEADDIALAIRHVVGGGWPVGSGGEAGSEGEGATLADIAILVPSRTSIGILTDALTEHGIPHRLEASSLVYRSDEITDLLSVLRAVDDPTDQISIVAALRSPFFGCGDDDLLSWHDQGCRFNYQRKPPADIADDHPVLDGLRDLAELHDLRWWTDVSTLIEEILRRRRVLELSLDDPRPRDAWRRLRFVTDQVRAFAETSGTDLRRWLNWVELQTADDAKVNEVVLPETDDDAVRILTIHSSKGLEFPVVILSGLNSTGRHSPGAVLWDKGENRPEARARKGLETDGYEELADHEETMEGFEDLRLLYVAATRARDHLIVSAHHKQKSKCHAATLERISADHPELWRTLPDTEPAVIETTPVADTDPGNDTPEAREHWLVERAARLDAARRPRAIAPTTIARHAWEAEQAAAVEAEALATAKQAREETTAATETDPELAKTETETLATANQAREETTTATETDPELAKAEADPERPPWQRGRAGTAIGRAVHATLQLADLTTGDDIAAIARAEAAAEGVARRAADVENLARNALDAPIVRQAIDTGRFWREIYVGAPVGDRVLEGFIDLLVEDDDGYAVVDYKTDQAGTDEELDAKLDRYGLQGAAYALALEPVLDKPVTRCVFVFLRPNGVIERGVADLGAAKARARQVLAERV